MTIYDILDKIELRPGMWLSNAGFEALSNFLFGYKAALAFNHATEEETPPFGGFANFALKQLGKEGTPSPYLIGFSFELLEAIKETAGTDSAAMELFFDLLRRYRGISSSPALERRG